MYHLAPYAARDEKSAGRRYKEPSPDFRSEYQRDRDRIIHCTAFRRLEYKTQVFVNHEGDMFRTRLTHSIEVAQIGRTIARAIHLNEDLTEAVCLAHDLGHTPFGHAGQDILNQCMRDYGGFEHNLQSLRVVDLLEERYADFPGLNLMFETREGILKHCSRKNAETLGEIGRRFLEQKYPGMEAQVANIADEIAYNNHDVDDGLRAGLISTEQLLECKLFRERWDNVRKNWPTLDDKRINSEVIRSMINTLVSDLVTSSRKRINKLKPADIDAVRNAEVPFIALSDNMQVLNTELKRFLRQNLYQHPRVRDMTRQAREIIKDLFQSYQADPGQLPPETRQRVELAVQQSGAAGGARIIADYIAGMTDRFAYTEHSRINPTGKDSSSG